MVFKNLCILVLGMKVASALEGLNPPPPPPPPPTVSHSENNAIL